MLIGTHIFLPVLAATAMNAASLLRGKNRLFSKWDLAMIGICGGLPDLLSPHIRLAARMASWTHTVWFLAGLLLLIFLLSYRYHRESWLRFASMCWTSAALHLICDAIAGGIAPFYPLFSYQIGRYYIPPNLWIFIDIGVIAVCWILMLIVRRIEWAAKHPPHETDLWN